MRKRPEILKRNNKLKEIANFLISSNLPKNKNGNLLGNKTSISLLMFGNLLLTTY